MKWKPTPVFLPGKPMDRGAWWATVHRVAKSQTRLSNFTSLHLTSSTLKGYSEFIEQVRFNIENAIPEPFTNAIKEAIKKGFLSDYLNRKSTEVQNMLLAEYDYDTDIAVQRKEAFDDGVSIGRNEAKLETAKTLLAFGDSIEKVLKVTGLSPEEIEKL